MQIRIFIIPIKNVDHSEIEMNRFLRSHRVLAVKKEFVVDGENPFRTTVPLCFAPAQLTLWMDARLTRLTHPVLLRNRRWQANI